MPPPRSARPCFAKKRDAVKFMCFSSVRRSFRTSLETDLLCWQKKHRSQVYSCYITCLTFWMRLVRPGRLTHGDWQLRLSNETIQNTFILGSAVYVVY